MIIAAFIETLPTVLFPNIGKTGEKYYIDNLRSAGINVVSSDYSDTVFSMGAQLLGFIGMFLIFLLFIYYFDWLSKKILKQKKIGITLFVAVMNYFIMIENSWNKFLSATRNMLMLLLVSYAIMRLAIGYKSKNTRSKDIKINGYLTRKNFDG